MRRYYTDGMHPLRLITAGRVDAECGYESGSPTTVAGAVLFFQLMGRRYEHASTVMTSNKSFEEWGQVLGDDVMAAALIDRVLHHCHIVNIRGNSYRMREHSDLWRTLQPDAADTRGLHSVREAFTILLRDDDADHTQGWALRDSPSACHAATAPHFPSLKLIGPGRQSVIRYHRE